ncbi:mechanosensitive ion channel family protein [Dysgonomonas sp. ZJ279]|uniref:mechanosensitive ion channel family protein n=1 Tax=Dysgonomonas sp. ZJ279 TaxID=2709796 RepID=UPI0013EAB724|nr:mechanosensitive ion channel family protein [Dysgonomonas sp. ZJ279]
MIKNTHTYSIRVLYILTLFLLCTTFVQAQKKSSSKKKAEVIVEKIDTIEAKKKPLSKAPVAPFRDTIFYVYGNIGSFTSDQRAEAISKRIVELEEDHKYTEDSLKLVEHNGTINILYNNQIIASIDTIQAEQQSRSKIDVAQEYRAQIISAIDNHREETSWQRIAIQVVGVMLILVAEYFLVKLIYYAIRRLKIFVRMQRDKRIKGLFGIIDAQREVQVLVIVCNILRSLLILVSLYLCVLLLFKLFPDTKDISDRLLDYVVSPFKSIIKSVIDYMPKLFTIIVIVVIFKYLQKFLRSIADKIAEGKITLKSFYPDWARPTYNIIKVILFVFMFILIFPYLPKSDSNIFQGVSVFAGIIISLGSTSIIGNLVAGLVITYMRPFKLGDRIKMGDCVGNVIEKTALVTRIKTPKNEVITIPNSTVMSSQTVNYSFSAKEYGLILYTPVTIGYDVPWQKVHELLLEVAQRTDNLSKKQKPFILQTALNDFYVEYQLNVYIKEANMMPKVYSDIRQNVQNVFAEAGVEVMSPHYIINRAVDGTDSTIPPVKGRDIHE